MAECSTCAGCGKIADDDDKTPWKYWEELPPPSNAAVALGIVNPLPCPDCGGTGTDTAGVSEQVSESRKRLIAYAMLGSMFREQNEEKREG